MPLILFLSLFAAPPTGGHSAAGLRMNQLQVIGTHNSYKEAIEPALLRFLTTLSEDALAFDYEHPPLADQLDLGLRGLELDLYHDPAGGRYAAPRGLALLRKMGLVPEPYDPAGVMQEPGFKVMHVADVDFRSHCLTLEHALRELRAWSELHPDHQPVLITVNLKDERAPFPDATEPMPIDGLAMETLDNTIRHFLGHDRLITPDLVRGDAATLEEAILQRGWPLVDDVRGRFLWVLDEGGEKARVYGEGHPSHTGRVFFASADPGVPEAAVLIINDPIRDADKIRRCVEAGYLVRTRADSETREARRGDRSRFEAAMVSGAQIISTDYPRADKRLGTGYRVVFDGGVYSRRNPITAELAPR